MSETFDPNAWPYPQGGRPQQGSRTASKDDDYDDLSYEDDDYDDYEDDDDDFVDPPARPKEEPARARNASRSAAEDDYDEDYEDEEDEYDDFDDDFGGGASAGEGGRGRKVIGIVAGLLILGALIVGAMTLFGGGGSNQAANNTSNTTAANNSSQITPASGPIPADVNDALGRALSAWGAFSVTGNMDLVRPYFLAGTNQYAELQKESQDISADPPGGEPRKYTMTQATGTQTDNGDWIVKGVVVVTRTGESTMNYPWEIRLRRQSPSDPWQIMTVRPY